VGAPTDPAALTFLTMTTRPSFRAEFKASEGGKTAVCMARCVNTQGERGSWSEVCAATAAAGSPNSRVRSSGARPASSPPLLCRKTGDARHSRVREVTRLDQPAYRGLFTAPSGACSTLPRGLRASARE